MFRRTFRRFSLLAAGLAWALSGCDGSPTLMPDGGPPKVLELADPQEAQLGLHYGQGVDLKVKYHLDDAAKTPIANALVKFAIFDDPGGSTLAADRATTDGNGAASVHLTAGQEERSFRVRAQAPDVPDVEFGIAVSNMAFVNIDVELAYDGPATIGTLEALLFVGTSCAQIPQGVDDATAFRKVTSNAGAMATLQLENLLSQNYAVVGKALDVATPTPHLQAQGCVDIAATLVPPGATATLPVPLQPVTPSVTGSYALTTELSTAPTILATARAPWHALTACSEAPAQNLLDAIESHVSSSLASAIEAKRGAATMGCRPATAGAMSSLDADLQAMLTTAGSPGAVLPSVTADAEALMASATIGSTLTIAAAGPTTLTATHALDQVTLAIGSNQKSYDVTQTALPVIVAKDVPVSLTGSSLTIGMHGFTLGLGTFFGRAIGDLDIAMHLPQVMPPDARALVGAVVAAALRNGKTGCAAVEDLVCSTTGASGCTGAIDPACASALDDLAAALEAPFAAPTGIDFTLSGQSTVADTTGDLIIDTLNPGSWATPVAQGGSAPFQGMRTP